jgi:two-component system, cell cycle sensor histidine kinase and response regulator CckA
VGLVSMRAAGMTADFAHVFLLFELAVSSVGIGLGTMVTRRNEAERKLAGSRAKLDRVTEGAQLGLWELDLVTNAVEYNERFAEMIGYRSEEIAPFTEHWPRLVHQADGERVREAMRAHVEGRSELFELDFRLRSKDGHWRWLHTRGSIMQRDPAGKPLRVSGTHVDVTDRKRAEAQVSRLLRIIEATPDFVVIVDGDGRVLYANAAMLAVCGPTGGGTFEVGGQLSEILPAGVRDRLNEEAVPATLQTGCWHGEVTINDARGRGIPTSQLMLAQRDEETDTHTFAIIMRDLSEQRRAEEERMRHDRELLQLQKVESLGVLAGGVAHDFNNLLTSVIGNVSLAELELPADSPVRGYLGKIEHVAKMAGELCQQMLAYAGKKPVAFAETDLNALMESASRLLNPTLGRKIELRLEPGESLPKVLAERTQMQQVVMNLVLNAAEAIGDREGRVTVRTRARTLSEMELRTGFAGQKVSAGDYVELAVEDTGCGMSAETQARIFEPFFTTKFSGHGLGLAAVAGVVRSHRGAITVKSEPDGGSVFRILFPVVTKTDEVRPATLPAKVVKTGGTILVVDDDALIRELTARLLAGYGYTVVTAGDGGEGVEVFREHAASLVTVLLDLTMPRMDGFEAHAAMHQINPRVPVILMSGFSQKLDNLPPEAIHPAGVLAKPFGGAQLKARLAAVLGTAL